MTRTAYALLFLLLPAAALPQTVYECPGQGGPTFSDTPCPGGKRMDLGPPNVIDTNAPASQATSQPAGSAYTDFAITLPENGGTIHTNTGQFPVAVSLTPPLQGGNGISLSLDGTQLPTVRYSLRFDITQEEWESAAAANVQHTLQAAVVDRSGNTLIAATPVQFYVHRAFIRRDSR